MEGYWRTGLTVVSSVGPADGGRVDTGLTRGHEGVGTEPDPSGGRVYCVPGESLEIESERRDKHMS